jgi:hypothetical protein
MVHQMKLFVRRFCDFNISKIDAFAIKYYLGVHTNFKKL